MNPVDRIKEDLGQVQWARCCDGWREEHIIQHQTDLNIFERFQIYVIQGKTYQFDFPSLPYGSYCYYAANDREAVRLRRKGRAIEKILAAEWSSLPARDPVKLSSFILSLYGGGIMRSHSVLADAEELRDMAAPPRDYRIKSRALARALPAIGVTSCKVENGIVTLRAITLRGWMHRAANLGIETITIAQNGRVKLAWRKTLARKIFDQFPDIEY